MALRRNPNRRPMIRRGDSAPLDYFDPSSGGGGGGTVTQIINGIGTLPNPNPLIAVGQIDLDIDGGLPAIGVALAAGDEFPVVDVSVGVTPAAARKATINDLATYIGTIDLTAYLRLLGRAGGQVASGGTAGGENLTLDSTVNAAKGKIFLGTAAQVVAIGQTATGSQLGLNVLGGAAISVLDLRDDAAIFATLSQYNAATTAPTIRLRKARGTQAGIGQTVANDLLGRLIFVGADAGAFVATESVIVQAMADQNITAATLGAHLEVHTSDAGGVGPVKRLSVLGTGECQIFGGPTRQLTLSNTGGPGRSSFVDPAHASNLDYTLPTAITASGYLKTTAGGVLSWNLITAAEITSGAALSTGAADPNVTIALGGSPTVALLAATSITLGWSGQLSIARGGTGQATAQLAFNALAPTTTRGDLIVMDAANDVRLPIGAVKTYLRSDGTDPSWQLLKASDMAVTALSITIGTATSLYTQAIADATVTASSRILVWSNNELDVLAFNVSPYAGGFLLEVNAANRAEGGNLKGTYDLGYLVF